MSGDSLRTSPTLLEKVARLPHDQAAWKRFVERYGPQIDRWCRRWNLSEPDIQDIKQNVLLKLAEHMRRFTYDPSKSFRAWLKTVTHHAWRDYVDRLPAVRRIGDRQSWHDVKDPKACSDLLEGLKDVFDAEILEEAMARVRQRVEVKTWEAFRRTAFEQQSGRQTAAELGMEVGAVFMAKKRVQEKLKEEIARLDPPDVG